ncbi:unnamed protein product [Spodoptera exigua]|nr:unnamed protein product [Spodoptera exigua]
MPPMDTRNIRGVPSVLAVRHQFLNGAGFFAALVDGASFAASTSKNPGSMVGPPTSVPLGFRTPTEGSYCP